MADDTYNGWTNYPTWSVALWLGNDEATDAEARRIADDWNKLTRDSGGTVTDLADGLREYVEQLADVEAVNGSASLAADLLGFALGAVDWHEIADGYALEAVREEGGSYDDARAELDRRKARYVAAILTRPLSALPCPRRTEEANG